MKRILITGANSFVGTSAAEYLAKWPGQYCVDTVDTVGEQWRRADFSAYDAVFHVAGIAHVNPRPKMAPLYYRVNRDQTLEIAAHAARCGVGQFIFMSTMNVYGISPGLRPTVITPPTLPSPGEFYGDSKFQAEEGLRKMATEQFRVAILRPCMIYGTNCRGNFPRLARLAMRTPVFPAWHCRRSMIYIDNVCEFVRQTIDRRLSGTFPLQNREVADTVEIVRHFARAKGHRLWCSRLFNPAVWLGALLLKAPAKMFSDQYYLPEMTTYDFDYQKVSFADSLEMIEI